MKNKGQLGNLQGIILALVIVGILLGAGFFIFDEFLDQTNNNIFSVVNETEAYINSTGYRLVAADAIGFNSAEISLAVNATLGSDAAINAANFTLNPTTGILTNATAINFGNVTLNYDYQSGGNAFKGIELATTALLTIPNLLGLIILIAMVGIILAVIFNVIPGARQGA